jgi:hypothetical protein
MPKVVEESPRAKRAAANMLDTPHLDIPYHMRGSKYTLEESEDRMKQARVRKLVWRDLYKAKQHSSVFAFPSIEPAPSQSAPTAAVAADPTPLRPRDLINELTSRQSAKPKKTRRTSLAAQQERVNALANKKVASGARMMASCLWNVESQKKEKGELDFLSIDQVREQVLSANGQAPCISTIYKDLQEGRIGESPKRRGQETPRFLTLIGPMFVLLL